MSNLLYPALLLPALLAAACQVCCAVCGSLYVPVCVAASVWRIAGLLYLRLSRVCSLGLFVYMRFQCVLRVWCGGMREFFLVLSLCAVAWLPVVAQGRCVEFCHPCAGPLTCQCCLLLVGLSLRYVLSLCFLHVCGCLRVSFASC